MANIFTPLFLLGVMRSGTTYFRNVLASNAQIMSLGSELNRFWTMHGVPSGTVEVCAPLTASDCVATTIENVHNYFNQRYLSRNYPKALCYRAYRKLRYGNETLVKNGSPFYLLNKSTHFQNKIKFVDAVFPDAKFIFIVRDVYSQSYSLFKHFENDEKNGKYHACYPNQPGYCWSFYKKGKHNNPCGWGLADLPRYWVEMNYLAMCDLNAVAKDRVLYIDYTDVVNDLPVVLDRVAAFLQTEQINKRVSSHLVNNQTTRPLLQWRDEFSADQTSIIKDFIAENKAKYNYIQSCLKVVACQV